MYEKVKVANSFQEEEKIHGSPSNLVAGVTKLEGSLKYLDKRYQYASNSMKDKNLHVDEHHKALF